MNEKFRAIGLDTEDKITEFIDYIDDLEDTEEIKSDVCKIYKNRNNLNYQREYVVECQKKNEDAIHIYHIHIPSVYQGRVRCAIDLLNNAKVVESGCVIPSSNCQIYYSIRKGEN